MDLAAQRLGTKLRLALLATAVLSILALTLASLPILSDAIREDRMKLFVEQFTRALAENVSHALENYRGRVRTAAGNLALAPGAAGEERLPNADALELLNRAAREPVEGVLPKGIFDLLVVVRRDGTLLYANTGDRFGRPLDTAALRGRHISAFPEEEQAWYGALSGSGKRDWYRSKLVARVRRTAPGEDNARQFAIAYAEPVPKTGHILVAVVNWEAVQAVLDRVEKPLADAGFPTGYAFMFAGDGNTIIGHKFRDPAKLNNYGTRLVQDHQLSDLSRAVLAGLSSFRYEYPRGSRKVSGLARIDDADFGWTVGLGISDSDVIAPMNLLTLRILLLGAVLILLALGLSHFLSQRITSDLRELTHSAERIARGFLGERVAVRSRDEVGQLATAFNQMTAALVGRDEVILHQQQKLMEQMRTEQELRIASQVQQRLFPQYRPPLASLDYAGFCQPARGVSGDYYDFLALAPGRLGLMLADVCGKGISAALLMASVHACARARAPLLGESCGELVALVNSLLFEATNPDRFATLFYAVYDDASKRLTYVNAGHHPPLLLRTGETAALSAAAGATGSGARPQPAATCQWLDFGTVPVGMFATVPAVQQSIQLARGDWLVLYSDGVCETSDGHGREFGREGLAEAVRRNPHLSAEQMGEAILAAMAGHAGSRPQADDRTLIVARVL